MDELFYLVRKENMWQRINYNFCKRKNDFEYCYNQCEKTCPSISNFLYGKIVSPIRNLIRAIQNKFVKCNQIPTKCSFLWKDKYCTLKDKSCYSNRTK